jgi:transcriptional regulator with XRE-family HTH domain
MFTGETLRLLRQTRQLKQSDMAHRMGISQQRYSTLERSRAVSIRHSRSALTILELNYEDAIRIISSIRIMPTVKKELI